MEKLIQDYWKDVLQQNENAIPQYFEEQATINWHNSNESFTVEEFIRANCEYPGEWSGEIEKLYCIDQVCICVVHVYEIEENMSFHVTSFIHFSKDKKIEHIDEYWGDDGQAPQWRLDKHIGTKIK